MDRRSYRDKIRFSPTLFNRIEVGSKVMVLLLSPNTQQVSNITDSGYLGPKHTLATFGPLLKPKFQNPRATLLVLFLNAVHEIEPYDSSMMAVKRSEKHRTFKYITLTPEAFARGGTSNADLIRFMEASCRTETDCLSCVNRGGDDVAVVIVDVSLRHLFHVYIVSFLRSLIYIRVLPLRPYFQVDTSVMQCVQ